MIENIISTAVKDDEAFYLRFLEDTFPYMDNYTYTDGMQQITAEMEEILRSRPSDPKDHALLLLYRARLSSDSKKAISYLEEALRLLPDTDAGNAALKGNLHATFGELCRKCHDVISARRHMDTAASIFRSFGLENTHDFMTFNINRSYFLLQTGSPREALENLLWLEQRMMEQNLYSVDYMLLQETLLYAYLSLHNVQAAQRTSSKLQQLYDVFYENDPKTLAAKNAEITEAFQQFRLRLR